jgi:integrase
MNGSIQISVYRRRYWAKRRNGRRVKRLSPNYTVEYRTPEGKLKRLKAYPDKLASDQLAAQVRRALARGEQGLVDPYREHRARPLSEHVADWIADRRTAGKSAKYLSTAKSRLAILTDACGWERLADVETNSFLRWRETRKGVSRNGTRKDLKGTGAATLNQYLDTARAMLNWCVEQKRLEKNPLAGVDKASGESRRKRRALTDDQVAKLLAVAPADRKLVYRVALATGLRRGEVGALQWGDLQLMSTRPYIQLRAEATKARRGDRVPMPLSLADELRKHKPADAGDGDRVFPIVPPLELWKEDLAAAGIPYFDAMGRQADFHGGTRKTLCTRMHRGNVPLATAMRTMRHTDARLTMVDYADDGQLGGEALPEIAEAVNGTVQQAGTGTGTGTVCVGVRVGNPELGVTGALPEATATGVTTDDATSSASVVTSSQAERVGIEPTSSRETRRRRF